MQVIGHRGAAALAPENTWPCFDLALAIGVDAIETDVRATSDGQLVLLHDERLDRTTDGTGVVHRTPWSAVRALDAGLWFGTEYRHTRVPLLYDTLERYGKRTHLVLEIKQPGIEDRVLEMIRGQGLLRDVTLTSFDWAVVWRVKAQVPAVKVGYLTRDAGEANAVRVAEAGLDQFCPPAPAVSPERVATWKGFGLEVRAWGVRDPELMMAAVRAGVDGMTVDFPHLLLEALGRTG
jgi:glycerophosphoryl diester phosphodiesterase